MKHWADHALTFPGRAAAARVSADKCRRLGLYDTAVQWEDLAAVLDTGRLALPCELTGYRGARRIDQPW